MVRDSVTSRRGNRGRRPVDRLFFAAASLLLALTAGAAQAAPVEKPLPEFKDVIGTIREQVAKRRGYQPNDILSRNDVTRVLKALAELGWDVAEKKQILNATLGDSDFLVRQLRSKNGVRFMRKLSGTKGTYARLDQLRRLKYGNRRIRELIENPGGHTLILYMTSTKGGKNLNRQLRRTSNGKNFGKPTGRIYKGADLLEALRDAYKAEQKRRENPLKGTAPRSPRKVR